MKSLKVIVSVLFLVCFSIISMVSASAELYPKTFIVVSLDYDNDSITLVDTMGEEWIMYGVEDWAVDDIGAAIMNNNNTPNTIYDDTIVMMYYQSNVRILNEVR